MVRTALLVLLSMALAAPAASQGTCNSMEECPGLVVRNAGAQRELATAGANALLGGATAALLRVVRGEPPWRAFWQGAVGGGIAYVGKRVAVEQFYGAGLVGREVASVGGSMVRNASLGWSLLEELVLPIGPVRLYVSGEGGVVPRVDLSTLIVSTAFMATYNARLDLDESVSAGALVFRGDSPMPGLTSAGATVAWSDMPAAEGPRLMAHERVHILQYDQLFLTWGEQLERWAVRHTPLSEGVLNHVDLGLTAVGFRSGLALALDYHARPWESEAYFLAQRVYPVAASN